MRCLALLASLIAACSWSPRFVQGETLWQSHGSPGQFLHGEPAHDIAHHQSIVTARHSSPISDHISAPSSASSLSSQKLLTQLTDRNSDQLVFHSENSRRANSTKHDFSSEKSLFFGLPLLLCQPSRFGFFLPCFLRHFHCDPGGGGGGGGGWGGGGWGGGGGGWGGGGGGECVPAPSTWALLLTGLPAWLFLRGFRRNRITDSLCFVAV